jgi:CubicO group peptidase (beta-lactamase class C family)
MDSEKLVAMMEYLHSYDGSQVDSLLIIRNGYVVAETYFHPFTKDSKHDMASVTKSVMGTLIGIAIDKGYIDDVNQQIVDFFPGRTIANLDAHKQAMTLEHLLTLRSGLGCIAAPAEVTLMEMSHSSDWVQFTLDLPLAGAPGERFVYCSPAAHLLSAVLQQATKQSALAFAREHLFGPLGISEVIWPTDPQGVNYGYGDLRMTTRDMAKLGDLYLNEGRWGDQQILPATWVRSATSRHVKLYGDVGFGYLWSVGSEYAFAHGRGGQAIYVLPDQQMVVVITGHGPRPPTMRGLIPDYVLPAVRSDEPLPANPEAVARLRSVIQQVAQPLEVEPQPVAEPPAIAELVSGETYLMEENLFGVQTVSLTVRAGDETALRFTMDQGMQFEWLVGLDGVERIAPGRFDMPAAARGLWETDRVFAAQVDEIGNNNNWRLSLTFADDQVTMAILYMNGYLPEPIEFSGSLQRDETIEGGY